VVVETAPPVTVEIAPPVALEPVPPVAATLLLPPCAELLDSPPEQATARSAKQVPALNNFPLRFMVPGLFPGV
jgi:hypothetical protein